MFYQKKWSVEQYGMSDTSNTRYYVDFMNFLNLFTAYYIFSDNLKYLYINYLEYECKEITV